jgi:hypothetical protein
MRTTLKFNFNKINESIFHFFGAGIFKELHDIFIHKRMIYAYSLGLEFSTPAPDHRM